jgi:gamma-glutamyltranspeptidase / glutathione hydrolase
MRGKPAPIAFDQIGNTVMPAKSDAMICAAQPEAAEAGARVLRQGGNAVDAAMAAALVQGVVDPQMCGIAGFGTCHIYLPKQDVHECIDFHGNTPMSATPEMWSNLIEGETQDGFGFILKGHVNDLGYQSITTPGSLLAYHQAIGDYGSFDWADICAPAIKQADNGFIVRPHVDFWWNQGASYGRVNVGDRLGFSQTGRDAYFRPDGAIKRTGDHVQIPDMAETLRRIAKGGADIFYHGEIADQIDADMAANGGLMRKSDLESYQLVRGEPMWTTYRGRRIASNRPPGGGVQLLEMLNILENFDLAGIGHNETEYLRIVSEAMKQATIDKDAHVGDPAFVDVPLDRLLSKDYATDVAKRITARERASVKRYQGGMAEPKDTTHVVVRDRDGNIVTMTHSLGMPSGVITDGLGFMYNGCMAVFDPRPGRAGSVAPGKSRFTSLCPSIVFDGDEPRIALGAPGGTQIAMGVLQVILNMLDFDMSPVEATAAPRFSSTSNALDITNRIPSYTTEPLEAEGYQVVRSPLTFAFAAPHAIKIDPDGTLSGGGDPSHDGVALGVVQGSAA